MNKYYDITYIFFLISLSLLFLYGIRFLSNVIQIKREELALDNTKNLLNVDSEQKAISKLDYLISITFDNYAMLNIQLNDNFFIIEDTEKMITKEVSNMVLDNISDSLLNLLSVYYKQEKIGDLITERVYLVVFAYLINYKK